jgi:predicted HTH domain antitoxin
MLILDDIFLSTTKLTEREAKLELVIAAYRDKKIGWGKGAEILGITQMQMWKELDKRDLDVITFDTYIDENGNLTL